MSRSGFLDSLLDVPLTSGTAQTLVTVILVVALLALAARRSARWLRVVLPALVLLAAAVTVAAAVVVERVWRPFPDPLPRAVYLWSGLGVLAVLLAVGRWCARDRDRRHPLAATGLTAACLAVVLATAAHIDATYDAYPTVRSVLGISAYRTVPLDEALRPAATTEHWTPPAELPAEGAVVAAPIPGATSGFAARDAQIYLPPAYFTDPRPLLPVLVLLAGQPGSPDDWLVGGRMPQTMDAFAADHDGLAPVVVVADGTGSLLADPLCVDSHLGRVATYLTVDVPGWVRGHLQVDPDPRGWAVGGLSYGGTCALQLATLRPDVFPTFLDMSGQPEPTLGDRTRTVDEVFGGDTAAFARIDPAELLARQRYPDSAGAFVVGRDDTEYRAGIERLADAARAAGMDVHLTELPGSHSFAVWSAGLEKELPWLSRRLGLVAP